VIEGLRAQVPRSEWTGVKSDKATAKPAKVEKAEAPAKKTAAKAAKPAAKAADKTAKPTAKKSAKKETK
jgi:hypothetical protein